MSGQAPWSRGHHAWHPTFFPGVPDVCHVSVSCSSEDLLKASRMSLHPGVTVAKYCRLAGWTTARGLTGEEAPLALSSENPGLPLDHPAGSPLRHAADSSWSPCHHCHNPSSAWQPREA
nr:uncharacterized protein LOC108392427 isoform X3 [Manis javanica]